MFGVFKPDRQPLKYWNAYEKAFTILAQKEGAKGIRRVFQALCLLCKAHQELMADVSTLCKSLYESEFLSDGFFSQFYDNSYLDPFSVMYDAEAEAAMKESLTPFFDWLWYEEASPEPYLDKKENS